MESNDLDSLLDDALADFDKPSSSGSGNKSSKECTSSVQAENKSKPGPSMEPPTDVFKEFFNDEMTQKLQAEWSLAMKELSDEDPELAKQMKMMSQAAGGVTSERVEKKDENPVLPEAGFDEKMKEALQSMSKALDEEVPTDEMMKSFLNLGLDDKASADDAAGLGMMEDLMKSMLSKEMLYPPMKELCEKFPTWLESNSGDISNSDKQRYEKQLFYLNKICKEFESASSSESEDVERERFMRIMDNINEMQKYGDPPEALVANRTPMPADGCCIS